MGRRLWRRLDQGVVQVSDECDRCERDVPDNSLQSVSLNEEHSICTGCIDVLDDEIQFFDWKEAYTEDQHSRAEEILDSIDEIECIISDYSDGKIVVHTQYVDLAVVADVCEHFGFRISAFGPRWEHDSRWPCAEIHGSIFEIVLQYDHLCETPIPMTVAFEPRHIDTLDGNDKQF